MAALAGCASAPIPGSVQATRYTRLDDGRALTEEIVAVETERGALQPVLLVNDASGENPRAIAVMFPGNDGVVGLPASAADLTPGVSFLVRTRQIFCDRDVGVAILDTPSDHARGLSDGFRMGSLHASDVRAVLRRLRARFPTTRMFLIGTSRGTLSAAHVARALGHDVDGVVLTSTVFSGSRRATGLAGFDFGAIAAPLLFVHHAADACSLCPYTAARDLGQRFPLITVQGGRPAQSGPCDALSPHGYFGVEAATVAAIKHWMLGHPYPAIVE